MKRLKKDLDHHLWKLLKRYGLAKKKIMVALSGGVDSVALLLSLVKTHDRNLIFAFHFHHGDGSNLSYRDQALSFCENLCGELGVSFYMSRAEVGLHSEADFREARYLEIERLKRQHSIDVVALGHHRDDLFETRLMRLIRGTGGKGLAAMREYDQGLFRPFLTKSKQELESYLGEEKQDFLEDPSNQNLDPLRNWLREEWLPRLEKRSPGSLRAFARSLETLVEEIGNKEDILEGSNADFKSRGLQRSFYLTLNSQDQKRLLAQYLFALGKRDFSQSHLEEIQKRLDNPKKVITFQVAGSTWEINAEQIKVQS